MKWNGFNTYLPNMLNYAVIIIKITVYILYYFILVVSLLSLCYLFPHPFLNNFDANFIFQILYFLHLTDPIYDFTVFVRSYAHDK